LQSNREGRYPSDHFPVTAELGIRWTKIKTTKSIESCPVLFMPTGF
jgi:hypothetical protein